MDVKARLREVSQQAAREIDVYRRVLVHPQTPRLARWCLGAAVAYFMAPIDLIPDFIPVLGQLDDVLIVSALVLMARRLIPAGVWAECRQAKDQGVDVVRVVRPPPLLP